MVGLTVTVCLPPGVADDIEGALGAALAPFDLNGDNPRVAVCGIHVASWVAATVGGSRSCADTRMIPGWSMTSLDTTALLL